MSFIFPALITINLFFFLSNPECFLLSPPHLNLGQSNPVTEVCMLGEKALHSHVTNHETAIRRENVRQPQPNNIWAFYKRWFWNECRMSWNTLTTILQIKTEKLNELFIRTLVLEVRYWEFCSKLHHRPSVWPQTNRFICSCLLHRAFCVLI